MLKVYEAVDSARELELLQVLRKLNPHPVKKGSFVLLSKAFMLMWRSEIVAATH